MTDFGTHHLLIFATEKITYYTYKPLNYVTIIQNNMFHKRHFFFPPRMENIEDLKNVFSQHS